VAQIVSSPSRVNSKYPLNTSRLSTRAKPKRIRFAKACVPAAPTCLASSLQGRFIHHGKWAFWAVHDPDQAIAIRLRDEHYAELIIAVDDPAATAKAISAAIQRI
jgi:hypothetical protein